MNNRQQISDRRSPPPAGDTARSVLAYERGRLWWMDLQGKRPTLPILSPAIRAVFNEAGRESAKKLARAMGSNDTNPILLRFATGRRCFAAWVDGEIAAYCWVSRDAECLGEMEREIQLQAEEAYIWNCATLPDYRRKGLYRAILGYITSELSEQGFRSVWIGSSLANRASIRSFIRTGFSPIITVVYVRFIRLYCLLVLGHPAASEELVASARRKLISKHEWSWGPFVLGFSGMPHLPACVSIDPETKVNRPAS